MKQVKEININLLPKHIFDNSPNIYDVADTLRELADMIESGDLELNRFDMNDRTSSISVTRQENKREECEWEYTPIYRHVIYEIEEAEYKDYYCLKGGRCIPVKGTYKRETEKVVYSTKCN